MERRRRDRLLGGKKGVAAPLVALYAVVVFTASLEWVAWQGPLVVGSLDVQTTDSGLPPLGEEPSGADGLFALLALISAVAALLLTSNRVWPTEDCPPGERARPSPCPPPSKAPPGEPDGRGTPVAGEGTHCGPLRGPSGRTVSRRMRHGPGPAERSARIRERSHVLGLSLPPR